MMHLHDSPPERTGLELFGALALLTFAVVIVAGGSASSPSSAGVARISSLPLLAWAAWRLADKRISRQATWPNYILAALAALPLLQLAPLPPDIWQLLPGRNLIVELYDVAGIRAPSLPVSLAPEATWNAFLSMVPPAAMYCAVVTLALTARRRLIMGFVLLTLAAILLGMMQVAGGPDSALRLYDFTNRDAGVGFFANRNHQAAMLVCAVPCAAVFAVSDRLGARRSPARVAAMLGLVMVLVVGIGVARSRAGVLLLAPAVFAGLAIATRSGAAAQRLWPTLVLGAAVLAGAGLVTAFGRSPLLQRFATPLGEDLRFQLTPVIARAGLSYAPVGSGLGSFPLVFQTLERTETMTHAFVNHAHNDFVEVWLEAGFPGLVLLALFGTWWLATTIRAARSRHPVFAPQALAGSAVVGLLMAFSAVDYPLRAPALATLFALGCGLMVPPGEHQPSTG